MIKLSILVCRKPSRYEMWQKLYLELYRQIRPYSKEVQLLSSDRMSISVGEKRNMLLNDADGEYTCFIDDDDRISENYISLLMEGINKKVDCCSLKGVITTNGKDPHYFEHALKHNKYETVDGTIFERGDIRYLRFQNHLNTIKASIAKQFVFPDKNYSEDTDWATQIHKSGLLKTEHYIPETIYYYDYISNKKI